MHFTGILVAHGEGINGIKVYLAIPKYVNYIPVHIASILYTLLSIVILSWCFRLLCTCFALTWIVSFLQILNIQQMEKHSLVYIS